MQPRHGYAIFQYLTAVLAIATEWRNVVQLGRFFFTMKTVKLAHAAHNKPPGLYGTTAYLIPVAASNQASRIFAHTDEDLRIPIPAILRSRGVYDGRRLLPNIAHNEQMFTETNGTVWY